MNELLLIGPTLSRSADIDRLAESEEYALLKADTAADGLALFRDRHPCVAMVEQELADANGLEILQQLCEEDPACGVIYVTDDEEMDTAIEVLRSGALDYFHFPVDPELLRVGLGRAEEKRTRLQDSQPPTVLVLDDHDQTRTRIAAVLKKEGYRVLSEPDGERGFEAVQRNRIDLILTDVWMPAKDGISLLRDAKRARPDVEVIVVTGHGQEDIVIQALREGAINFLRKPIDLDQMLLAIEKALDYQNTRRSLAFRNREIALMHELVVRLTQRLELVIETPERLSTDMGAFVRELATTLPFRLLVANPERQIIFCSADSDDGAEPERARLDASSLAAFGVSDVSEQHLINAFDRVCQSAPGTIEAVPTAAGGHVILTPVTMQTSLESQRFVAVVLKSGS